RARDPGRPHPRQSRHAQRGPAIARALRDRGTRCRARHRHEQLLRLRRLELQPGLRPRAARGMTLAVRVEGLALVGPGLASWDEAREILAGRKPYEPRPTVIPAADALPAVERRRAGKCVRLA